MELDKVRKEIDDIDSELLSLFLRRMDLGKKAMLEKKKCGKPVMDKSREREILKGVSEKSGEMSAYSHRMFKELLNLSRSYQNMIDEGETKISENIKTSLQDGAFPKNVSIACQGIEGANSQMAADRLFPQGNIFYFKSFEGVCDAVKSGLCDYGVLPVENSSYGSVHATYEIMKNGSFSIVRSIKLCIRHELLAKPRTKLSDIKEIISHEQAIGQCGRYLKTLGDKFKISSCLNTAIAAKIASENEGVAAISSPNCAELYGLAPVTNENIQDSDNNYTRFVCISAKPEIYPGANKISFIVSCRNDPGELYKLIAIMDTMDVNITKLESKPIIGRDFEFMFFIDIEAGVLEPGIIGMLEEIERNSESFVFLGNYQEI